MCGIWWARPDGLRIQSVGVSWAVRRGCCGSPAAGRQIDGMVCNENEKSSAHMQGDLPFRYPKCSDMMTCQEGKLLSKENRGAFA
jgi:hypothetical protein